MTDDRLCDPSLGGCGATLPLAEFNRTGGEWYRNVCKDCDNRRPRKPTEARTIRNRARHRAKARLIDEFRDRYDALLEEEIYAAEREFATLAALGDYDDPTEPVRLRPGQRRAGQDPLDRIDVARCRRCHAHHDASHVCQNCGLDERASDALENERDDDDLREDFRRDQCEAKWA